MKILPIITVPNELLRRKGAKITVFDKKLHDLIDDMTVTLISKNGLGLAAPQVGASLQVCLIYDEEKNKIYELINPQILETKGECLDVEGCLSIPDTYGLVKRPEFIKVKYYDRHGKECSLTAKDYLARIFFHEIDHLHGNLFVDIADKILTLEELLHYQHRQQKIIFMGTPEFSVPILRNLVAAGYNVVAVVTQPDRLVGRKKILTASPVKLEAQKLNIPVLQPESIKSKNAITTILDYDPDLIITAAYGQIVPREIIEYPEFRSINVHASLLPKYRGGAPIHHAIINGEQKTGITIIYMTEKLDAGDMLAQHNIDISEDDDVYSMHNKLSQLGSKVLEATLPNIFNSEITAQSQNIEQVTYAPNIHRKDERIIWAKTGNEVYNQIRGLSPWPIAYTMLNGQIIKIRTSEKIVSEKAGIPGQIMEVHEDGFIVATNDKMFIKVTAWQIAGKKSMQPAKLVQNKHPFLIGERFE